MSEPITYGIDFPFNSSTEGKFLKLTNNSDEEIRANLIHLLLTRKGSRYFMPDFGTNLYQFIFNPMDSPSFSSIENEIRESCRKYIPNLRITNFSIKPADEISEDENSYNYTEGSDINHTIKVRIDYTLENAVFETSDFVIINI